MIVVMADANMKHWTSNKQKFNVFMLSSTTHVHMVYNLLGNVIPWHFFFLHSHPSWCTNYFLFSLWVFLKVRMRDAPGGLILSLHHQPLGYFTENSLLSEIQNPLTSIPWNPKMQKVPSPYKLHVRSICALRGKKD